MAQDRTALVYRLTGPKELVLDTEPLAEPGTGLVEATTLYSAISPGTEVAAYDGAPPLRPMKVYPRLIGYCNVARVDRVGPGVEGLAPGDLIYSHQSHRSRFVCDAGRVTKLPQGCDSATVSTAYLYHLGYNALLRGGFTPGERVGVIGLGTLGLAAVDMATACGAEVVACSNQTSSLEAARACGAFKAVTKDAERVEAECDLVILTSNAWTDYELALKMARVGGKIALMGFPGREDPIPPFNPLASMWVYDKQLTLFACGYTPDLDASPMDLRFTLKRNLAFLARTLGAGRLHPSVLISRVASWKDLGEVYEAMSRREPGLVTAVLDWEVGHDA